MCIRGLTVWAILLCGVARGSIILDQQPLNTGGLGSDTAFLNDGNQPTWQQVADDVALATPASVARIIFWGFYGGNFDFVVEPPPVQEDMRVRFYDARPGDGLPGTLLLEESFQNPMRTPTGRFMQLGAHPPEMRYQVDLVKPIELQSNVPYWLEIVQLDDLPSHFRWENSPNNGHPIAFKNPITIDWRSTAPSNINNSFQLQSIPEPSTVLLGIVTVSFIAMKRRNVRRPHRDQEGKEAH